MQKKILYVEHGLKPYGGGHEGMLIIFKNIDRSMFDLHLYSLKKSIFAEKSEQAGVTFHENAIKSKYLISEVKSIIRSWRLIFFIIEAVRYIIEFYRFVKRERFQVLHPCDNLSVITCLIVGRLLGIPVVFHIKDDFGAGYHRFLVGFYSKYASFIIPTAKNIAVPFLKKAPSKTIVVYDGFDLGFYNRDTLKSTVRDEFSIPKDRFCISVVAVLKERKGHIYLLKALKKMVDAGLSNFVCFIVGEGDLYDKLRRYCIENDLADKVIFTNFRTDPWNFIIASDLVVLPSLAEGLPKVSMEGLALKTLCAGSRVSGMPEILIDGKTGFLFSSQDVESLFEVIKKVYKTPLSEFNNIKEAGYSHLRETFSIDKCVRSLEEIYNKVTLDAANLLRANPSRH
ncbi:MAG: glycosyltransferase family 4 protein [Nitrospirae bacterium]|nr:glycosyltransferase family 4 protein [Nitrospirota bacterium]MBF0540181.1 glycosyltransferase family 4 protein [Nitrospirota bacterium]